ncbi:hypothetical protein B0H19DRAFT_92802 [Mycena capillaripes]|nr:hypothetical protein B0H19DRAFT_92802 [Mycena capillaripes]
MRNRRLFPFPRAPSSRCVLPLLRGQCRRRIYDSPAASQRFSSNWKKRRQHRARPMSEVPLIAVPDMPSNLYKICDPLDKADLKAESSQFTGPLSPNRRPKALTSPNQTFTSCHSDASGPDTSPSMLNTPLSPNRRPKPCPSSGHSPRRLTFTAYDQLRVDERERLAELNRRRAESWQGKIQKQIQRALCGLRRFLGVYPLRESED